MESSKLNTDIAYGNNDSDLWGTLSNLRIEMALMHRKLINTKILNDINQ